EAGVSAGFARAVEVFRALGASLTEVTFKLATVADAVYDTVVTSDALAVHQSWFRSRLNDYGTDMQRRLLRGMSILATQYLHAQRVRRIMRRELNSILRSVDVLVCPTVPVPAPPADEPNGAAGLWSTLVRFTQPFNVTGHPAMSLPCGFDDDGLPIGLQIVGRLLDEAML